MKELRLKLLGTSGKDLGTLNLKDKFSFMGCNGYLQKQELEEIFTYALSLIKGIVKNDNNCYFKKEQYEDFVKNGSVISFWNQGISHQIKNNKIETFEPNSSWDM